MRVQRSPTWRERCCRFNRDADATSRAGCACPFSAPGYIPTQESARDALEVSLPGGTWWRGRTCPGAVVEGDPLVQFVVGSYGPLEAWHQVPFAGTWGDQPGWWTRAVEILHSAMLAVDREERAES